jgi:chemosensory pili system protein ChpA (sensor histidine kinase/response regulator)
MSISSQVDPNTLGWVKTEIDETLKQARLSLETFAEDRADTSRLRFCITHLHQVVGTLLMVELDGAAMLAKETESLAEAIYDGETKPADAVIDSLVRGILSVPDYLARLQFGQPDSPIRLIPILNDLRAAHGVAPISELELFKPDLGVRPPDSDEAAKLKDKDFVELAKQLRHPFQQALLNWLRNTDDADSLGRIGEVVEELRIKARLPQIEQLFWVAGGIVEAFRDRNLEPGNDRKRLVSRLDQTLKKLIDGAERSVLRDAAEDLTRAMLFELAQASRGGERVTQLKQAFGLDALLPAESGDYDALPTPEALKSVGDALGDEIRHVQELLANFYDEERDDVDSLEPMLDMLHSMANAVEMLGITPLKDLLEETRNVAQAIIDGRIVDPEIASMPLARALLLVEQSAHELAGSPRVWKQQVDDLLFVLRSLYGEPGDAPVVEGLEVSDAALSDIEFRQLASVVGQEVRHNLTAVEESFEAFAANVGELAPLQGIPENLGQIEGALQILGQEAASAFTARTRAYIEQLIAGEIQPTSSILDGLAISIGTVGAFMDGLQYSRANLDNLLDAATSEMDAALQARDEIPLKAAPKIKDLAGLAGDVHASVSQWTNDPENAQARNALAKALNLAIERARQDGRTSVVESGEKLGKHLAAIDQNPDLLTPELVAELRQLAERMLDLAFGGEGATGDAVEQASGHGPNAAGVTAPSPLTPIPAGTKPRAPAPGSPAADVDEEIMEIFIEDAKECFEGIQREFPAWRASPDNMDALKELRRFYHTLKGSGRMVGASDISELAWAIENMLNKVRDGKIAHTSGMFELLEQVMNALPPMIHFLEGGDTYSIDVDAMRSMADAFAEGRAPGVNAATTIPAPAAAPTRPAAAGAYPLPDLDATLRGIFISEAQGHLATVKSELDKCRDAGSCNPSSSLMRATHTLRGSARSVGLRSMSDACGNMEKLLVEFDSQQHLLTDRHLDLLARLHADVDAFINVMGTGATDGGDTVPRLDALAADIERELNAYTPAPAAPHVEPVPERVAPAVPVSRAAQENVVAPAPVPSRPSPAYRAAPVSIPPDHIDPELMDIFQEEAIDLLRTVEVSLQRWRGNSGDRDAVQGLKRALHTIKGGARMAGAMGMGYLAHNTETLLEKVDQGSVHADRQLFDLLDEVHDTIAAMLDKIQSGGQPGDVHELAARVVGAIGGSAPAGATPQSGTPSATPIPEATADDDNNDFFAATAPVTDRRTEDRDDEDRRHDERRAAPREGGDRRGQGNQIRVRTALLNELVNYAGEVSISRSRMEQQVFGFRENLQELHRNVARFRDQLRDLEIQSESQILYKAERAESEQDMDFDPLEFDRFSKLQHLSRSLSESLHDLITIQHNLGGHIGEAEAVLQQQARLNTDLQEGLMRTRMVEFATQAARLRHIVRQTAREVGKRVDLDLSGANVEMDRNVLERMVGPFEHMIRNAIDHGIEDSETRVRKGKPAQGTIKISTAQEGSEIVIRVADDGAGLDVKAIRAKAIERGLIGADSKFSDADIVQFILVSGFSTAKKVTHLSGRGVGMDVVHNEVKQLGGTMSVDAKPGRGTTFTVRLPLTLSITQALMTRVGDQIFAIPIAAVENIVEVPVDTLDKIHMGDKPLLHHGDKILQFTHLANALGINTTPPAGKKVPVLLIRSGTRELAIQIDGLIGTREVVIKPVSPQLATVGGIAGATILGDGRVVLILDIAGLLITEDVLHVGRGAGASVADDVEAGGDSEAVKPRRPVLMVVDDSLTVRKVTSRIMQKRGVEVLLAKDGQDAIEQLQRLDVLPDVMLVDIEMPRMDGYELTSRVRSSERLRHIPIIMITSRAGEKHRKRAFELGVNEYMSKPYQEDNLVQTVRQLLPKGVVIQ